MLRPVRLALVALLVYACGGHTDFAGVGTDDALGEGDSGVDIGEDSAVCGNGIAEGGELCDDTDIRDENCASATMLARPDGRVRCSPACTLDTSECVLSTPGTGGAPGGGGEGGQGQGGEGAGGTMGSGGTGGTMGSGGTGGTMGSGGTGGTMGGTGATGVGGTLGSGGAPSGGTGGTMQPFGSPLGFGGGLFGGGLLGGGLLGGAQ